MAVAGYALSAVVHLGFLVFLVWSGRIQRESSASGGLLKAALLVSALWATAQALAAGSASLAWASAAVLLDVMRYALWLAFLYTLVGTVREGQAQPAPRALRVALVAAVMLAALLQGLRVAVGAADRPTSSLVVFVMLALPVLGMLLVEQLFRNLGDHVRWVGKPLCLALAIVFGFDLYMHTQTLLFGRADPDTLGARGPVHALAVPFLLVAARRRADWIARLQVSRTAVFHTATLLLAGVYLLFVSGLGYYVRYFGGTFGRALQLALLFAAIALLVGFALSGSARSWLRVFVGKHFFSYRFDYREEWLRFTAMLATRGAPDEVGRLVVRALADLVECPGGSLWTRASAEGPFRQVARWNTPQIDGEEAADSAFADFLRRTGWVIDLDQLRASPRLYDGLVVPTWLLGAQATWLVVPLMAGDELLGFVLLTHPRTRVDVNWEVLDLLKTASRQAASHLAQMQATEALLEARKFDAFNRMSAFVVHDLKNIVTQLSLMLKNAERLHDNREFQQDMLLTVESSLAKMRRLMLQLREGTPAAGVSAGVELGPIVQRLQALAKGRGRTLEVRRIERLATRGHEDRLERVLGHLVQNALDATAAGGAVWMSVERESGQVRIEVGDAGEGMTEEFVQTRLFKPFSSTKGSGMGVGSYESAQYVRELGGRIDVASRPGAGTTITVRLPLFERQHESDLMPPVPR
ncbi:MAG: PEP-CTERM system histidine kinase PrsK [Betaproteobacteria bacterium]|nr:PEP-CTERM system histidine kinase PrsK [Betaproteobacteria bacterium]